MITLFWMLIVVATVTLLAALSEPPFSRGYFVYSTMFLAEILLLNASLRAMSL